MTRVTGYKCIFQTNDERFKFALTLADEGEGDFIVADADAVETLLDMFEDSSEAHFDSESGELTFAFEELEMEDEEEQEDEGEEEEDEADEDTESGMDDDAEKHASSEEASLDAEEGEDDGEDEDDEEEARPAKKTRSRRSAA